MSSKPLIQASLKQLYEANAIIIDSETTGFSKNDEVIDLAIISFQTGQVIFQEYFIPQVKINPFAERVHKLSLAKLIALGAKQLKDYHATFDLLFNSEYPIIAYNAEFDKRLLNQSISRHIGESAIINKKWHCGMKAYQILYGKQVKLDEACANFNVAAGLHSAESDATALRELLINIMEQ
jgi:DNA polymerase III epsilon subunit-like protein